MLAPGPAGTRLRLELGDEIDAQVYLFGEYDPKSRQVMEAVLGAGDLAVDAGANIGYFSLVMARAVGPSGAVLAFEPAPDTFTRLQVNLDLNRLGQVKAIPHALGSAPREVALQRESIARSGDTRVVPSTAGGGIPMTTLDAELKGLRPRLVKIDVEGLEWEVLRGAEAMLATAAPVLLLEVNTHTAGPDQDPGAMVAWLALRFDYRCFQVGPAGLEPFSPGPVVNTNVVTLSPADLPLLPALNKVLAGGAAPGFEVWPRAWADRD